MDNLRSLSSLNGYCMFLTSSPQGQIGQKLKLVSVASLACSVPITASADNCTVLRSIDYQQLALLSDVSSQQAEQLNLSASELDDITIDWALAATASASGRYPLLVHYASAKARYLASTFDELGIAYDDLRGRNQMVTSSASFISSYQIDAAQQARMEALIGNILNQGSSELTYDQKTVTLSGPTVHHDLLQSYECLVRTPD